MFVPCAPKGAVDIAAERPSPTAETGAVLFAQVRKNVVNNAEHRGDYRNKQGNARGDEYALHSVDCKSLAVDWR